MIVEFRDDKNVDVNYEEMQSERVEGESVQNDTTREASGKDAHDWHMGIEKEKGRELNVGIDWSKEAKGVKKKYEWKTEFAPKRILWGVLLVLAAGALLLGQMGYLGSLMETFSVWDIILTIFFLVTLVEGISKGRIGETLFSVAFLINIHDELLGLEAITPWTTLGVALLATIGLKMIFPKAGRKHKGMVIVNGVSHDKGICEESRSGNSIKYENVFSSAVKYVAGEFSKVDVDNAFGSMQIYFSDAQPIDGSAKVNIDSAFGTVTLYVPSDWKVVTKTEHIFGSTGEKGQCNPDGEIVLYVNAEAAFGNLQIKYI